MSATAEAPRRAGAVLPALLLAPALLAVGCGDGRTSVDVVEQDRPERAAATSGAAYGVVAELRVPETPERIVYDRAVDLRRPPGAETWPPTAEEWPGPQTRPDTREESARASTTEPTEPADTAAAEPAGADAADADTVGDDVPDADPAGADTTADPAGSRR